MYVCTYVNMYKSLKDKVLPRIILICSFATASLVHCAKNEVFRLLSDYYIPCTYVLKFTDTNERFEKSTPILPNVAKNTLRKIVLLSPDYVSYRGPNFTNHG